MQLIKQKIHINQIGYQSHLGKKAVYIGNSESFAIINEKTQRVLYTGVLTKPVLDSASGDVVRTADFSTFNMPGKYYIKIGIKKSHPFKIDEKPFKELKNGLLKGLYYNRCDELTEEFAGEFAHQICHREPAALFDSPNKTIDVSGGWHDSGNYGKYVVSACTTLAYLLYAFKIFPDSFSDIVGIPESKNKIPDILNECRVGLLWLLKMQGRDGGVHHKVVPCEKIEYILPEDDRSKFYVFAKSHQATAAFTACTALAAQIFEKYDAELSNKLKTASINAWIWLMNNPVFKPFENPSSVRYNMAGDFFDDDISDDIFWACCELYSLTGDNDFHRKIIEMYSKIDLSGVQNCNVGGFGAMSYMLGEHIKDKAVTSAIKASFRVAADNIEYLSKTSGYETAKSINDYGLASNLNSACDCIKLIIANRMLGNDDYINTAVEQLNYLLGKNPNGICFVTGFGSHSVKHPHHRPSIADRCDAPVPGLLVCGPNSERKDEYTKWSIPMDTPPAKCYADNDISFSTNEPAIYYNAALIFVLAYIESLGNADNT